MLVRNGEKSEFVNVEIYIVSYWYHILYFKQIHGLFNVNLSIQCANAPRIVAFILTNYYYDM